MFQWCVLACKAVSMQSILLIYPLLLTMAWELAQAAAARAAPGLWNAVMSASFASIPVISPATPKSGG